MLRTRRMLVVTVRRLTSRRQPLLRTSVQVTRFPMRYSASVSSSGWWHDPFSSHSGAEPSGDTIAITISGHGNLDQRQVLCSRSSGNVGPNDLDRSALKTH